jgi:hypothetical protein
MHPRNHDVVAQQYIVDMRHGAERRRLAKEAAAAGRPGGRRVWVAQLFAWLANTRASGGSEQGHTTEVSKGLTHELPGVTDVAVARVDAN